MSAAQLTEMRCEIIDELHDEIEALSWQRMVLLAMLRQMTPYGITRMLPDDAVARVIVHHNGTEWPVFDGKWGPWRSAFDLLTDLSKQAGGAE